MNTEENKKGISRREMLGKSAKYAALVPVSTLIATKASAHQFSGTNAECKIQGGVSNQHCDNLHPDPV